MKKLLHNDEKCVTIKALYVNLLLGGIRIMATFYASKTGEVSAREKEHSALVRALELRIIDLDNLEPDEE